jgi:O-antigen ligase
MTTLTVATARNGTFSLERIERGILWLLFLHASDVLVGLLQIATGSPEGGDLTNRFRTLVWLGIYCLATGFLFYRYGTGWITWLLGRRPVLCAAVAVALLSFIWSISPVMTLLRGVHLVGTTLVAVYVGYCFKPEMVGKVLALVLGVNMILGAAVSIALPEYGQMIYEGDQVWRGLQGHKNGFAALSAFGFLLFFVQILTDGRPRPTAFVMCAIGLANIWMADSKTALICALLAAGVVALLRFGGRDRTLTVGAFLLTSGAAVLGVFFFAMVMSAPVWDLEAWTAMTGRSTNFSGRTEIWGPAWSAALRSPLTGYGYGAVWFPHEEFEYVQQFLLRTYWTAFHGHNGFLHIAPEIGLPAAFAVTGSVLWTLRESLSLYFRKPAAFSLFVIAFEIAFILKNVFEASMLIDRLFEWLLFIALSLCVLRSQEIQQADPTEGKGVELDLAAGVAR